MDKAVVIIPIYNEVPKEYEIVSLRRCFEVLKNYPLRFVCSKNFNTSKYLQLVNESNLKLIEFEQFDDKYFEDVAGYNKLLMSSFFYERFINYKFILICQTDAYVFNDELEKWCDMDYDYIGAPWLMDMRQWLNEPKAYPLILRLFYKAFPNKMQRTGNGGLSLRKTESFIKNLRAYSYWARVWKSNEDNFFSQCIGLLSRSFKIPDYRLSLQFSFDAMPEEAYKRNKNKLPFGCHAFNRDDGAYQGNRSFWLKFIPSTNKL